MNRKHYTINHHQVRCTMFFHNSSNIVFLNGTDKLLGGKNSDSSDHKAVYDLQHEMNGKEQIPQRWKHVCGCLMEDSAIS